MVNTHAILIHNRREFKEVLESRAVSTYEGLKEEQKLKPGQNLLKSYLIEINTLSPLILLDYLEKRGLHGKLYPTDDKRLFNLIIQGKKGTKLEGKQFVFYLDALDERFWVFHTLEKSEFSDRIIKYIVYNIGSRLDHLWLPITLLEGFGTKFDGYFKGLGAQYKFHEVFGGDAPLEEEVSSENTKSLDGADISYFSMRLWGEFSNEILKKFRTDPELRRFFSLSSVGIKRVFDEESFSIEDIHYWAKITAKGTSIYSHFETIEDIRSEYYSTLRLIEDTLIEPHILESGYTIKGSAFIITLENQIPNLKEFVKRVFNGKPPFRIWSIKDKVEDDETYLIFGTDLHNGDPIEAEITPNWIRIYLKKGACGNTILRFLTNIQRYYDPQATLESEEYGKII